MLQEVLEAQTCSTAWQLASFVPAVRWGVHYGAELHGCRATTQPKPARPRLAIKPETTRGWRGCAGVRVSPERSMQTVPPLARSSFEILTLIEAPSALPFLGLAPPTVHLEGRGNGGGCDGLGAFRVQLSAWTPPLLRATQTGKGANSTLPNSTE
jgi:hypothetical protein